MLSSLHEHLPGPEPCYVGFEIENDGSRPALNILVEFRVDGPAMILRERNDEENDEDNVTAGDSSSSARATSALPGLPPPPTPPAWKKEVANRTGSVGRHINEITPVHDRTAARYQRLLRDIQGPLGAAWQLDNRTRLLETTRVIRDSIRDHISRATISSKWDIPSIPNIRPRNSESFYFDDWSPDIPVKVGALTCGRFRHQCSSEFFSFRIVFADSKERASSVLCTVHAENLTQPVRFRVRIEQIHVATKPVNLLEQLLVNAGVSP